MKERLTYQPEVERGKELIIRSKQISAYLDQPYTIAPRDEISRLRTEMEDLDRSIPDIDSPKTLPKFYLCELKRRMKSEAISLGLLLKEDVPPWEEIVSAFNIPTSDLDEIEKWLKDNLSAVETINNRRLETESFSERSPVPLGVSNLRYQAEGLVNSRIVYAKEVITNLLGDQGDVSEVLCNYRIAADSGGDTRSYFNWVNNIVGISTLDVTYMKNGRVHIVPEALLSNIGHEVLGHARHNAKTSLSDKLPYFASTDTGAPVESSAESVAQYFERRFFDFLLEVPDVSRALGFEEPFEKIYRRYQDTLILREYRKNLIHFGILTLAKTNHSDHKKQFEILSKYSIDSSWPSRFINRHSNNWDKLTSRLASKVVAELRYAANPVQRIIKRTPEENRPKAEELILCGFWTPPGLEQRVGLLLGPS